MIISKDLQQELRYALLDKTGCRIQHDGWPCGTCFFSLSSKLNNRDWQTVLAVRGDYDTKELDNLPKDLTRRTKRIIQLIS